MVQIVSILPVVKIHFSLLLFFNNQCVHLTQGISFKHNIKIIRPTNVITRTEANQGIDSKTTICYIS